MSLSGGWRTPTWLVALGVLLFSVVVVPGRWADAEARLHVSTPYGDFGVFVDGARCLVTETCSAYDLAVGRAPNLVPPHAHVAFIPFVEMDLVSAYILWTGVSVFSMVVVVVVAAWQLRLRWITTLAVIGGLTTSVIGMAQIASANLYGVLAIPMLLAWLAWRRGRVDVSAAWIGLAASVKLLLLFPLVWLWLSGRHRAAALGALTAIVPFVAGLAMFGMPEHLVWLQRLATTPAEAAPSGASLYQSGARLSFALGDLTQLATVIWAVGSAVVVAVTIGRVRAVADASFAAVVVASMLISPKGWIEGAAWLVGPAQALWMTGRRPRRLAIAAVAAIAWLPLGAPEWGPLWGLVFTVALLILWLVAVVAASGSQEFEPRARGDDY